VAASFISIQTFSPGKGVPVALRGLHQLITGVTAGSAMLISILTGAAKASQEVRYVALGDSYSAGLGAGNLISSSGSCDRSPNAYSRLWASAHHPASYVSVACAGATTSSVISSQLAALKPSTTLVSITVGGNDVGFSSTMETCVLHGTSSCVSAIKADEAQVASALPGELNAVLAGIGKAAPDARVVVLGYPDLYDLSESAVCPGLSTTDRTDLNQAAGELDSAIRAAAGRAGDVYAGVAANFSGHLICDSGKWLHAVNILDLDESYHPTAAGQAGGYLPAFTAAAAG
jgi:lysophospholipase L1-like esterase